ncbi:hypothetical protein [Micromonospora sp. HM5-17]|jgi:hypothetical protein|uniref:hypothetical protein n=1 Tax=Micromonospora sp. HM5-17 TaxID=2487710 RepID=UPI0011CE4EE2|nr:hypothetical protein [Micromonospora sp. HM5-17]
MRRGTRSNGIPERLRSGRNRTKRRRLAFARRAEEFAAQVGVLLGRKATKAGRKRPLRTERGGRHTTRSVSAVTRGIRGVRIRSRHGRRVGLGRKRVRPG